MRNLYHSVHSLLKRENKNNFFLPWRLKPVLEEDQDYFVRPDFYNFGMSEEDQMQRVFDLGTIGEMKRDVFNLNGKLVLRARDTRLVVHESFMPLVEMKLVEQLIECTLTDCSEWIAPANKPDPVDVVKSFIISESEYYRNIDGNDYVSWAEEGILLVIRIVEPLLKQVTRFIDDDTWVIHTLDRLGTDFVIEKTIDYRISEYERLKGLGIIP